MSEIVTAETWLQTTLSADAVLMGKVNGIYAYIAPKEAVYPFVIYRSAPVADVMGVGAKRIWVKVRYEVFGIGEGNSVSALEDIADQIDADLHAKTGGSVISCVRVQPLAGVEVIGEQVFSRLGGLYELQVQ